MRQTERTEASAFTCDTLAERAPIPGLSTYKASPRRVSLQSGLAWPLRDLSGRVTFCACRAVCARRRLKEPAESPLSRTAEHVYAVEYLARRYSASKRCRGVSESVSTESRMPGGAMMRTAALYAKSAAVALALLCALAVAEENHGFSSHVITDVNEMSFDEIVRPPKMLSFINFYSDVSAITRAP